MNHCEPEYQRLVAAWQRAEMISCVNPDEYRRDSFGAIIRWLDYSDEKSPYGWHVRPVDPNTRRKECQGPTIEAVQWKNVSKPTLRAI
jgi:hypothetical protein